MSIRIIGAGHIRECLPMAECIRLMDQAMRAFSAARTVIPVRQVMPLEEERGYFFLMPGSMSDSPFYGAKIASLQPANPELGKPTVQGFVALFERESGTPVALLDGAAITAMRTAAASALATRELARPDARSHGIFGNGVLAAAHIEAIACVRHIEEVRVWGRNNEHAIRLAGQQAERMGIRVIAVKDPAEAAACDIVSTVTNAPDPVLRGRWLRPGCHLNLVGAHAPQHREADSETVAGSAIYVDSLEAAMKESGDILTPISEGRISRQDIAGEIGELLAGAVPGRSDERQITLYKSLGIVAQDLAAAEFVYRAAEARELGTLAVF
jgi:ornithine cyclodeaminase